MSCAAAESHEVAVKPSVEGFANSASELLFTDHIPRSLTCKRFAAKRVAVNGVNSNASEHNFEKNEKVIDK